MRCGTSCGAGWSPTIRSTRVRAFAAPPPRTRRDRQTRAYRSRRATPPAAQGRWSLVAPRIGARPSPTEWATGMARQLLTRHGVLTREAVAAEGLRGGFSTVYDVLKTMEESGRIRRGLFVGGLGAMQFALPAALDLLRSVRDEPDAGRCAPRGNRSGEPVRRASSNGPRPRVRRGMGAARPGPRAPRSSSSTDGLRRSWHAAIVNCRCTCPTRSPRARSPPGQSPPGCSHSRHPTRRGGMLIAHIDGVAVAEHPLLRLSGRHRFRPRGDGAAGVRDAPGTYAWASRRELTSAALVWFSVLGLGAVAETPNTDY